MNKKILIIEDEINLAEIIKKEFLKHEFSVEVSTNGDTAVEDFYRFSPNLVLLDINLPRKNGWEICREIRDVSDVPIIIMTARDTEMDEIQGLELGANDYITKPFSLKIMVIKIKKLLKLDGENIFKLNGLMFDFKNYIFEIDDMQISFTKREVQLLEYFTKHKGLVLTREAILNEIWGYEYFGEERAVDTLVTRVRKKMGNFAECIKSMRGVGYVFDQNEN
ncbi:MAG: response regulator transcription factor [Fusobacteriaceae bacterium]